MSITRVPGWVKVILKLIIGVGIILFLSFRFNLADIFAAFADVQVPLLVLAVVIYAITLLLLSLRWRFILKRMGHSLPVLVTYQAFVAGILISDLTPARIGELSRPLTIRERLPIPAGLGSVFLDRYCDFVAIFILGCGGILLLSAAHSPTLLLIMVFILSIPIILLSAFWFQRVWVLNLVQKIRISRITDFAQHLSIAMDSLDKPGKTMGTAIIFTLGIWILQSSRIVIIATAVGYFIPIQELILIQPLISALALIPISLSGLGFVEGGYVTLFTLYGIPVAVGLAIALLDRVLTVMFHLVIGIRYALRTIGE